MKKVLLVYPGYIVREQPLNILYISAAVKAAGHESRLFEITPYRGRPLWGDPYRVIKTKFSEILSEFQPDVIGFSVMSVNTRIAMILSRLAKHRLPGSLILFGGIHPTIAPEETIREDCIDILCIGEGDETISEFLAALDKDDDVTKIKGLWVKHNGQIIRNPVRPLIQGLDALPLPDREALSPASLQAELYGINLLSSRGCPYPCAYCQNKFLIDLYKDQGKFVRYRSVDNVLEEIAEVVKKFNPSRLSFSDESFTLNKKHLEEFCSKYPRKFQLPFLCQTRPDLIDREKLALLKEAGCDFINMAIESGNPKIRNDILKRHIPTEKIIEAYSLAREFGIRTASFNMIGLPEETLSTVWDTINLNKLLQPDRIMCTVYMPFKGTELGEKCLNSGWLESPIDDSEVYYTYISIQHPSISGRDLFGYQGFFDYYVRLSPSLYWLIHFFRRIYQLLPKTSSLPSFLRAARESIINFVYKMKRFLPSTGFFMQKR